MWKLYREKTGPLHLGVRMEQLIALSDHRRHVSRGGQQPFRNFLRFHKLPDEAPSVGSLEQVAKMFGVPYQVRKAKQ